MRTLLAAAVCLVAAGPPSANALDTDNYKMQTFGDVVTVCGAPDAEAAQFCRGWLVGNGSLYMTLVKANAIPQWACADPVPSLDEIRRAIVAYGSANPQMGDERAVDGFWRAASAIWPCSK